MLRSVRTSARVATRALPCVRAYASEEVPELDKSKIPKSLYNEDGTPQYFGIFRRNHYPRDIGDYPDLKMINTKDKSPYVKYWDVQNRRNKGEVLHEQDDILSPMGPEMSSYPVNKALRELSLFFLAVGGVAYAAYLSDPESENPAAPRTLDHPIFAEKHEGHSKHARIES